MRNDDSLLLLRTPMMPPPAWPNDGVEPSDGFEPGELFRDGGALRPVEGAPMRPRPDCCGDGPLSPPPGTPPAARITSHSPRWFIGRVVSFSVIGSLYFFRRKRPCTSTSRLGG